MIQTESMKEHACLYKPIVCPESWCDDCQIYLDYKGHLKTMGGSISSSIYPIENLKIRIQYKRLDAFNETCCGSREHKLQAQAMVNAYDTVLSLLDGLT